MTADLTPDGDRLTVAGHQKYAEPVWKTFFAAEAHTSAATPSRR